MVEKARGSVGLKMAQMDQTKQKRLVEIAREHTGLAAEAGRRETTEERKEYIGRRIAELRHERDLLLGEG